MGSSRLSAFMAADIRATNSPHAFSASNCRVYRFSPSAIEVIIPKTVPEGLNQLRVTLNLSGLLALNVPAIVNRRVVFQDYDLLCVNLNPETRKVDEFALQRMENSVSNPAFANADGRPLPGSVGANLFDFPCVDGFLFSHPNFEVSIDKQILKSEVYRPLSVRDFETYLAVTDSIGRKIADRHGYFERVLDTTGLENRVLAPLDILQAFELHLQAMACGMKRSFLVHDGVKLEYDLANFMGVYSGVESTPEADSPIWRFSAHNVVSEFLRTEEPVVRRNAG